MFRLTLLAALVASASLSANDGAHDSAKPYQARPEPVLPAVAVKARQRDISDLYFIHFHGEPLAVAARSLQQVGIHSMQQASGRLNVQAAASQQYLDRLAQMERTVRPGSTVRRAKKECRSNRRWSTTPGSWSSPCPMEQSRLPVRSQALPVRTASPGNRLSLRSLRTRETSF